MTRMGTCVKWSVDAALFMVAVAAIAMMWSGSQASDVGSRANDKSALGLVMSNDGAIFVRYAGDAWLWRELASTDFAKLGSVAESASELRVDGNVPMGIVVEFQQQLQRRGVKSIRVVIDQGGDVDREGARGK